MGSLSCLNVSGGDISITFDRANATEAIRAKRIIKDMLKRGYALLVKMDDGTYQRALGFDAERSEYLIADHDPDEAQHEQEEEQKAPARGARKGRTRSRRLAMEKTSAVGVARSAGG